MADIIQLVLQAKNEASAAIKQVQGDLKSLDSAVGNLNKLATLQLGLTGIESAIQTIQQLGQAVAQTSQAGAEFDRLSGSFNTLADKMGTSGTAILQAIDSVTQGTLSQKVMMQQADNAMLLGVAKTSSEFETLAKIAVDRGRAMGISMEYAFESIVKGVGRLSPLILDNLGIVLDADKTYADFAKTLGKTADQLSDAEKRTALIARLKQETQDFDSSKVMDASASWEKFSASIENATAALGGWINTATPFVSLLQDVTGIIDVFAAKFSSEATAKLRGLQAEIKLTQDLLDQAKNPQKRTGFELALLGENKPNQENIKFLEGKLKELRDQRNIIMGEINEALKESTIGRLGVVAPVIADMSAEYAKAESYVKRLAKAQNISTEEAQKQVNAYIDLKGSYAAAIPVIAQAADMMELAAQKAAAATAMINGALSTLESAALQAYADSGYNPGVIDMWRESAAAVETYKTSLQGMDDFSAKALMKQTTDQLSAPFQVITDEANAATKAMSGGGKATKTLTKEFQDLRSIVEGLFTGAMGDIGGADLEKFLPYQDKPGEAARRIADVMVNGFKSPWVDFFKNSFPDLFTSYMGQSGGDIQKAAALLLKDYQDGLRPELIDKDKIKELAIRMFKADAETKKMVDDIAKDLAKELGISVEEAQSYAGGAAGVKKKAEISPEKMKELQDMITKFKPTWDFGDSKKNFQDAGKAAGVLDDQGRIKVPVVADLTNAAVIADLQNQLKFQIIITGAAYTDKAQIFDWIKSDLNLPLQLYPQTIIDWDTRMLVIKTNLRALPINLYPTTGQGPEGQDVWQTFFDTQIKPTYGQFMVQVMPYMSVGEAGGNAFSAIGDEMKKQILPEGSLDTLGFDIALDIGNSIAKNIDTFKLGGALIALFMNRGFEEQNIGTTMASTLSTQLALAQKSWEASAANTGKTWGNAFLKTVGENVPLELITILTNLVTPEVQKKLQENKERGGG